MVAAVAYPLDSQRLGYPRHLFANDGGVLRVCDARQVADVADPMLHLLQVAGSHAPNSMLN